MDVTWRGVVGGLLCLLCENLQGKKQEYAAAAASHARI
jgi:hypothetical protein